MIVELFSLEIYKCLLAPTAVYLLILWRMLSIKKDERCVYISDCSDYFETFILLRTTRFKNNPSGTSFFYIAVGKAALFVNSTLLIYIFYIKNLLKHIHAELDPITVSASIVAIVATFYWNERQNYISKWEYLANLYNKHLEFTLREQREAIITSLAHDILLTEMWGHRTFKVLLSDVIREAEGDANSTHELFLTHSSARKLVEKYSEKVLKEFKEVTIKITHRQVNGS